MAIIAGTIYMYLCNYGFQLRESSGTVTVCLCSYEFQVQEGNATCVPRVAMDSSYRSAALGAQHLQQIHHGCLQSQGNWKSGNLKQLNLLQDFSLYLCYLNVYVNIILSLCTPINLNESSINPDTVIFPQGCKI